MTSFLKVLPVLAEMSWRFLFGGNNTIDGNLSIPSCGRPEGGNELLHLSECVRWAPGQALAIDHSLVGDFSFCMRATSGGLSEERLFYVLIRKQWY